MKHKNIWYNHENNQRPFLVAVIIALFVLYITMLIAPFQG